MINSLYWFFIKQYVFNFSGYVEPIGMVICELWILSYVGGGATPVVRETTLKIASLWTKVKIWDLPNREQEC